MFFENFYENLGFLPTSLTAPLASELFGVDLEDPLLARPEYCFKDGGKLILPYHLAAVRDEHYFSFIQPLIDYTKELDPPCVRGCVPFRVEISILQPKKSVLWHHDQHLFHKFSERLHYPIVTTDKVTFLAKWFTDDSIYEFKMLPGHIYRFNNRTPHSVDNDADTFRCHVMIDWIKKDVLDYFQQKDAVLEMTKNVAITPTDEIFYYVNRSPKDVELRGILDADTKKKLFETGKY